MSEITSGLRRAEHPFQFVTQLHLTELTGLRAATLPQLLRLIRELPESSIHFHTHHFLEAHQLLIPEPPNDFALWVERALGDERLAEQLAAIDTLQFSSISALREAVVRALETYLARHPTTRLNFARPDEEFFGLKAINLIIPTPHVVHALHEFRDALSRVSVQSLYYHLFQSRLRLGRTTNDFSAWLETELVEPELARRFERLDLYTATMETLRAEMVALVDGRLREEAGPSA